MKRIVIAALAATCLSTAAIAGGHCSANKAKVSHHGVNVTHQNGKVNVVTNNKDSKATKQVKKHSNKAHTK